MQNMTKTTGKTTPTINLEIYSQLLVKYQPRIIQTEEENENFLEVVDELMSRENLTNEEDTILDLLVKLIEDFEEKHYPLNNSTPRSVMLHLMEAQNLSASNLVEIFGSSENVDKVMTGKLEINVEQAVALGKMLHVDFSLFINQ
ncbi:HTH-type transcriptional regulator [Calothrix sp. NIES-4071]|nr:HTH-type transcriptional regulator [Calothrix sp. NIES-4071]BAZ59810.1 HTH-type transcriptional regulator [Calothrix sp. NIES-4105]